MASVTFRFIQNETVRDDGTQLVLLRITYQRKHKYIGTGVYLREKHFNPDATKDKENWVRKSYGTADAVNTQNGILKAWLDRGEAAKKRLTEIGQPFTADDVKQRIEQTSSDSLAAFIRHAIQRYRDRGQEGTANNQEYYLRALCRFMGLDPKTGDFTIYQLSPQLMEDFETYLLTKETSRKGSTDASRRNSTSEKLRKLHQYIRAFIVKHKLPDELDPLRGRIFESAPTRRVQLSEAEVMILAAAKLPTQTKGECTLNNARNIYLCSYFLHGLRARDLIMARVSQLTTEWQIVDNVPVRKYRFMTTALKTDKTKYIYVEDEILPILLDYATNKEPDDFLFPFLKTRHKHLDDVKLKNKAKSQNIIINGCLKTIAETLKINKPIYMHSARHTFADMLMEETGDIRLLQASLDHSEISTTERYFSRGVKQSLTDKANSLYRRQAATRSQITDLDSETLLKQY
ncbi:MULTISPECIES: tyrosine-type recombinase/integrase [unclassified Spirosoma]|uniref:tyrosine-type recombinase/integrase n=1 Tax=unclassified Spirosoma TaxID=2621999 RepID=UPI000963B963|nr:MULTISPECIES: tyrosine-type recombinase/integrase [unclassified Spirosoma]MBN8824405.1 tyrosine-type recombinase/integrase [Spirosoma sp.]OJW70133.1 MAG: hypothetical protein BGO59_26015 [Spirosoma sp. 48-14]